MSAAPLGRLVGLLLCGLLVAPAFADPTPSPSPPEPEDPIRVELVNVLPRSLTPHSPVEILGRLRNVGSRPVTDLRVRVQVGAAVTTRSELEEADADRPPTDLRRQSTRPVLQRLDPGQVTTFDVRTDVASLGLSTLGVYPLDLVARGNAGDGLDNLGLSPTWLPYFDGLTPKPTKIAVLWPLVDRPHLGATGGLVDDDLAPALRHNGRLDRLLGAARTALTPACEHAVGVAPGAPAVPPSTRCLPVPVTLAVDPDLLDTVQLMTSPYKVGPARGTGTADATAWLSGLRTAGDPVLALPYADPDVAALSRNPRTQNDVATDASLGGEVARQVLGLPVLNQVAWPPPGPVPASAADALALTGARTFVLDPSAYDGVGPTSHTPDARSVFTTTSTGTELHGLVVDPDLSALLSTTSGYGPRVDEQRFLAETAIISAQRPGRSRILVIAPPRRGWVSAAAGEALRDLGRVPWLCPVGLSAVADGTAGCPDEGPPTPEPVDRGELRTDAVDELTGSYLDGVAHDREDAAQLTDGVLSADPDVREAVAAIKSRLRRAVARAESSAAREDESIATTTAAELHDEVQGLVGRVIVRGGRALLTSTKGTLSVNLENTLRVPVQVRVRFTSKTATLSNAETGLVTVQPGHAVQASVHAQAQRSGQFVVFAQLVDRNGKPFGPETEIIVRSTRFGRLALVGTLGAFAVLLVAAGVRIMRRARGMRT